MTDQREEKRPEGEATLRVSAMPRDVNINGDIFGGWVLSQMDSASGIVAGQRAKGRVATVAVDAMKFIRPVKVGNILCVWAWVERVGRSSMGVRIEAWAFRHRRGVYEKVTEAVFTYVAIDEHGNPRPVPPEDEIWPTE
ncbi:putative acyl-CoA thioester hydrolase [Shimia sp. SK013]|uniref:acyl-CoA thioesterase n=1 Tax=Shimia sp. SK013 TaxID=1389006 RepID=UPI0006B41DDC|nr:acyl-CoA thioesterase [Shimia sp. SK013]KPA21514.1 putative acyl-CoA thioester hydrolase [Shimia sp. SK013]